ncbi:hypothetical protein F9K88_22700, partial [Brucella intermedia]|uniref:hypothetical protein n=1 Tax=Brucella intermedia TaxID=94625 RepID=UPI00124C5251
AANTRNAVDGLDRRVQKDIFQQVALRIFLRHAESYEVGLIDEAPVGRIYKDGKLIGDEEEIGMVERRKLAYVGHVAVSVLL